MTAKPAGRLLVVLGVVLTGIAAPAGPALAAADSPDFDSSVVDVRRGGTAEVGITVPEGANDSYRLQIGSREDGFLARATVHDADGDGSLTVAVDTETAGNGDPGSYLDASEGDALRNATQVTSVDDSDRPLAAGTYELSLSAGDEALAVGTLVVVEPDDETTEAGDTDASETTMRGDAGTNFVYDGDTITLRNATGQTVRGETSLDPGTDLTVRIQSPRNNFLQSVQVTVSEDGTFAATFDLYDVAAGATFEARVISDGNTLASAEGRVLRCSEDCDRAATTDDRSGGAATTLPADELAVQSVVEVTRTKTANIPVTFGDAEALTVVIGGPEVNYVVTGTVRDADGDGRAVVRFHTESAGFDAPTLTSEDELEQHNETSLASTLEAGNYPVRVYRGRNASGDPAEVARVVVYEAGASPPTETTDRPSTTAAGTTAVNENRDTPSPADSPSFPLDGFGALALGGTLAVAGIGVLLGIFRR